MPTDDFVTLGSWLLTAVAIDSELFNRVTPYAVRVGLKLPLLGGDFLHG